MQAEITAADSQPSSDDEKPEVQEVTPVSPERDKTSTTDTEDDFDLTDPLKYITEKLEAAALCSSSTRNIVEMNIDQKIAEKAIVKAELRAFDVAYMRENGVAPGKSEKEPLRPIYQLYRNLSNSIEKEKKSTGLVSIVKVGSPQLILETEDSTGNVSSLDDNAEYLELKKEKRRLQCLLHKYQEDFINKYGRNVQYLQDREPVQKEYEAYKVRF